MLNFDSLRITTMTVIIHLSCNVYIEKLFYLLPVSSNEVIKDGKIISLKYKGERRGLCYRTKKSNTFRNSITANLVMDKKIISVKIFSKNKIQMCGLTSEEMAYQSTRKIIEIVTHIQNMLDRIKTNKIEWGSEESMFVLDALTRISWEELKNYDRVIDTKNVDFKIQKVMVNFNYDLGYSINRLQLSKEFMKKNNFKVRYENSTDYCVFVRFFDKNNLKHIFIIYKSGLVTQSGPDEKLMGEAYKIFLSVVNEIRTKIIKEVQSVRRLKYLPVY
jgi:hypothetical protein